MRTRDLSNIIGTQTVAAMLGVSRMTVTRMATDGRLKPLAQIGKSFVFDRAEVEARVIERELHA